MAERRSRASSSEAARAYRQAGHDNAAAFAEEIGMEHYTNDHTAKKDVIDPSGDAHSLKSGAKKWQIFLYRRSRFLEDDAFQTMGGVGGLLVDCIDAFPLSFEDYTKNKSAAKKQLQIPMRKLCALFQNKTLVRAFLMKAIFNGGEVNYMTVLFGDIYHVFLNSDVVKLMGEKLEVTNSGGVFGAQKVLFRYNGKNLAELEMRNDSEGHYREVRMNMIVKRAMELLFAEYPVAKAKPWPGSSKVLIHGGAQKTFGRWKTK